MIELHLPVHPSAPCPWAKGCMQPPPLPFSLPSPTPVPPVPLQHSIVISELSTSKIYQVSAGKLALIVPSLPAAACVTPGIYFYGEVSTFRCTSALRRMHLIRTLPSTSVWWRIIAVLVVPCTLCIRNMSRVQVMLRHMRITTMQGEERKMQGSFPVREYTATATWQGKGKDTELSTKMKTDERGRPLELLLPGVGKYPLKYNDEENEMLMPKDGFVSWHDIMQAEEASKVASSGDGGGM